MSKKAIVTHGVWLAAVLLAYFIGNGRAPEAPNGDTVAGDVSGSSAPASMPSALGGAPAGGSGTMASADRAAGEGGASNLDTLDMEGLVEAAMRADDPIGSRIAFAKLLQSMDANNAMDIRGMLLESGARGELWRDFNYRWGAIGGEEVVLFAAESEERDLNAALSGWASANPDAAMAFLDNLPEDMQGNRREIAEGIVAGLADRSPELAANLVLELAASGAGDTRDMMSMVADRFLRTSNVDGAVRWSESLPDGPEKGAAMRRVAATYARQQPEEAARWVESYATDDYAARVVEEVSDRWAERDPQSAVGWLEQLPEGAGQVAGLRSVFGDWEDRDPLTASQYLADMAPSTQRDSAIAGFSRGYAWQDPEAAIAWAGEIDDPRLRQETLARAGEAYLRRDREAALQWIETGGLPDEVRNQLLQSRRR